MTNILIKKRKGNIVAFEISGHTGYADNGKDIVCAAVSSISQSACLGIKNVLKINALIKTNPKDGYLSLRLPKDITLKQMEDSQIVLETMKQSLEDLLFDYKDYIKLEVQDEIY